MEVLNDILGYRDRKIYQDDQCFSFSLDSVILANLVSLRFRDKKILDLGTGNGVIPLILSLRTNQSIVGVELQEKLSSMAWKSVCYNHLEEQISIVHMDMKEYAMSVESDSFDVITCNPPYFKYTDQTIPNFSYEKFLARHEVTITLGDVFCICRKLLKNGGKFAIVHRADCWSCLMNLGRIILNQKGFGLFMKIFIRRQLWYLLRVLRMVKLD